ncbi:MAG: hypothetical protein DIJKHBIC_01980 [Thermoanaerobaculia bacterium]|nr:hypothetical protein [Thermoanaerobaculia bacterium]
MKIVIATDSHQPNEKYRDALLCAGALPEEVELLTPGDPLPEEFDGLLLAGGADVDPARYRETVFNSSVEIHPERDRLDFDVLEIAGRIGSPVFGICRGLQVVNVARGGTLWQDLPAQRDRGVKHDCFREDGFVPRHEAHPVRFTAAPSLKTPAFEALRRAEPALAVNSRHHQAVKDLAAGLLPVAASSDDLVEAFEDESGRIVAVQWHPEDLVARPAHRALFAGFIEACRVFSRQGGRAPLPLVEVSLEGAIPVLRLNRGDQDNMLAGGMAGLLADSLEALLSDATVPALVVTAAGRSFCRGADPRYVGALARSGDEASYAKFLDEEARAILAVARGKRPVLSALEGPVSGFGLSFALVSDVRVVASRGRDLVSFSASLHPSIPDLGSGATYLFSSRAGTGAASDLFFSGETIPLARARELRLIDYWVEEGSARAFALSRASTYAVRPPPLVSTFKALLSSRNLAALEEALQREKETQLAWFRTGELLRNLPVPARPIVKEPPIQ